MRDRRENDRSVGGKKTSTAVGNEKLVRTECREENEEACERQRKHERQLGRDECKGGT